MTKYRVGQYVRGRNPNTGANFEGRIAAVISEFTVRIRESSGLYATPVEFIQEIVPDPAEARSKRTRRRASEQVDSPA